MGITCWSKKRLMGYFFMRREAAHPLATSTKNNEWNLVRGLDVPMKQDILRYKKHELKSFSKLIIIIKRIGKKFK
ncbi:MAG: hypothetical protein RSA85_05875, partial [Cellulosilyticaceae bacterium]